MLKRQTELKEFHFFKSKSMLEGRGSRKQRVVKNTQERKNHQEVTEDRELALGLERHYDQVQRKGRELGFGEDSTRGSWRSYLGLFTLSFKKRTRSWQGKDEG